MARPIPGTLTASGARGARSALIVANDAYDDPKLAQLRAPAADAEALARVLSDAEIGGFKVEVLANEPSSVLRVRVSEFFDDRQPEDFLLLHFSCHGWKDNKGQLYFATSDTNVRRVDATAISASFVKNQIEESRAKRVVLLLDCCYAGAFTRGATPRAAGVVGIGERLGDDRELRAQGRGVAVLTASDAMQYAYEGDNLTNKTEPSFFTNALVKGLETGEADRDNDSTVSIDDLYDYVFDAVRGQTNLQTPEMSTFGVRGELYLARRPPPSRKEAVPRVVARDYSRLEPICVLEGEGCELFSLALSPDSKSLAAGSEDRILLWQGDGELGSWGRQPPRRHAISPDLSEDEGTYFYSVVFDPDGKLLAAGGEDGFVRVFEVPESQRVWEPVWAYRRHEEAVYSVAFSRDGSRLASGGYDRRVVVWEARTGLVRRRLQRLGRVSSVAFSPGEANAAMLAIASLDNTLALWDTRGSEPVELGRHGSSIEAVAFSLDGQLIASCGLDKSVNVWDVGDRARLWSNPHEHEYLVRSVSFSPNGATLASASWDKTIKLWDSRTGEPVEMPSRDTWPKHTDWIWSVAFNRDGTVLASCGSDGKVLIWGLP